MDFHSLTLCGELLDPPMPPQLKVEFIGDSITGGLHNLCRDGDVIPFAQEYEDGYHAYDGFASRLLPADIHVAVSYTHLFSADTAYNISNGSDARL